MAVGDRGKWAEGKVRDALKGRALQAGFQFMRLPDARAGSFQPTTADFLVVDSGRPFFLEVKEVNHVSRLPGKNFDQGQRARLALWEAAGARSRVLICHSPLREVVQPPEAKGKIWRAFRAAYFGHDTPPSWDLHHFPLFSLTDALEEIFRD